MIILDIEPANLAVSKQANRKDKYKNANLYQACDDSFVTDAVLDESALLRSQYHQVAKNDRVTRVTLDKSAPDFPNLFLEGGTPVAPDEILETLKPLTLKIPIKYREDFGDGQLPLAELLSAIQYYASHLDIPKHSLDETALLAVGILAETWADEMVTNLVSEMFLEPVSEVNLAPSSDSEIEDSLDNEVVCWSDEESDIMSIEMEDSDTEEEERDVVRRASSSSSDSDSSSATSFSDSGSSSESSDRSDESESTP